jgi:hypothetical protein
MSKPAWEYLTTHLPEIRQAVLPNTGSKIGEPGLALLLYLSGQTNPQGEFFMTAKTMQEETGLATLRQVEKLLAGFVALGWITPTGETNRYMNRGRPAPVYVLTLFPQYARLFTQTLHKSEEIPSGETVEELSKANGQKDYKNFREIEPEPEPEPDSEPDSLSVVSKSARQEKEGINADEVLRICIELETEGMTLRGAPIMPGVIKKWKAEYPSAIAKAITERHGDTAEDIAWYCHNLRAETRTGRKAQGSYAGVLPRSVPGRQLPDAPKGMEGCLVCGGDGYGIVRDDKGVPTSRKCVCKGGTWEGETTQVPTQERVSADQSGNTYIPTPVASADPQSGARDLGDITGQLLRKLAKPIKPLPD